ncbi:Probable proteasome subunit beta type-4 [Saitozyma sp. JCM 24511]|nr:Probable proteasome subunit beta type-4 [Saitozyma sp. JCM 24511]
MECSFGLTGSDFVLLASDMSAGRSIIQMKSDENKIKALGPHLAMAYGGEPGDTNNFADYVERNMRLYHIRHNQPLLPPSASAWVRRTLAESIRSRKPYAVNLLLAGYDISTSLSHLYWIDYLGTKAVVPYAAHGLGVYVALSTMDKWWYPDIQRREGVDVLKKCVNEVEKRLTVKFAFNCILIDKDGIHNIDLSLPDPIGAMEAAKTTTTTAPAEASLTGTASAAPVSAA